MLLREYIAVNQIILRLTFFLLTPLQALPVKFHSDRFQIAILQRDISPLGINLVLFLILRSELIVGTFQYALLN